MKKWLAVCVMFACVLVGAGTFLRLGERRRAYFESTSDFVDYAKSKGLQCHGKPNAYNVFVTSGAAGANAVDGFRGYNQSTWTGVVQCAQDAGQSPADFVPYRKCGKVFLMGDPDLICKLVP